MMAAPAGQAGDGAVADRPNAGERLSALAIEPGPAPIQVVAAVLYSAFIAHQKAASPRAGSERQRPQMVWNEVHRQPPEKAHGDAQRDERGCIVEPACAWTRDRRHGPCRWPLTGPPGRGMVAGTPQNSVVVPAKSATACRATAYVAVPEVGQAGPTRWRPGLARSGLGAAAAAWPRCADAGV
ncbi:hypothetical protein FQR65_LT20853 [Abscondita terminalis]|nr:hypothetical protein FQR65_LT20853 [Abscondita terminalis]